MKENEISRYMAYLLRHNPSAGGLALDAHGWAEISALLSAINLRFACDEALLLTIVRKDTKGRYAVSEDGTRIRARQGHSIAVDAELLCETPPDVLYHGTAERNLPSILEKGLLRGTRLYVHLSRDAATATEVGRRHGTPTVLRVDAARMVRDGYAFYLSENGVWLTPHVPREYLTLL